MYSNAPLFIQPESLSYSLRGCIKLGVMCTLNIHVCKRQGRTTPTKNYKIERNRNEYPHCHATRFLYVFFERKFKYDFVFRYRLKSFFQWEVSYDWGMMRHFAPDSKVGYSETNKQSCLERELEPLSGQTLHKIITLNHCPVQVG